LLVVRSIDHTHATGPDFFEDTVVAERLADHPRKLLALILGGLNPRVNGAVQAILRKEAISSQTHSAILTETAGRTVEN
jgi:hypothetical protein